jgi:hypothetical protein
VSYQPFLQVSYSSYPVSRNSRNEEHEPRLSRPRCQLSLIKLIQHRTAFALQILYRMPQGCLRRTSSTTMVELFLSWWIAHLPGIFSPEDVFRWDILSQQHQNMVAPKHGRNMWLSQSLDIETQWDDYTMVPYYMDQHGVSMNSVRGIFLDQMEYTGISYRHISSEIRNGILF